MNKNEHLKLLEKAANKLGLSTSFSTHNQVNYSLFVSDNKTYCLLDGYKLGYYPNNKKHFIQLAHSKNVSENYLKSRGFRTLDSFDVRCRDYKTQEKLFERLAKKRLGEFPLLIKPETGLKGKGIVIVQNQQELQRYAKKLYANKTNFLIQNINYQQEYRILYAMGTVVFVHTKSFPTITGDGNKTARELFNLIEPDKRDPVFFASNLEKQSLKIHSVVPKGLKIPYHVTRKGTHEIVYCDSIPPGINKWAKSLAKALSADTVGIDVFIDGPLEKSDSYTIIEVNGNPGFTYLKSKYKRADVVTEHCNRILKTYFKI